MRKISLVISDLLVTTDENLIAVEKSLYMKACKFNLPPALQDFEIYPLYHILQSVKKCQI